MSTDKVQSFRIKVQTERVNLHSTQSRYIEDLYRKGEITDKEKIEMMEVLQQEWK